MILDCPVTGLKLNSKGFAANLHITVSSIHPVIALPVTSVNKIYLRGSKNGTLSEEDCKLIFCAYLYRSGLVTYGKPLPPSELSIQFVQRYMELVSRLANNKESAEKTDLLPGFNTNAGAVQLGRWLDMINEAILAGHWRTDTGDSSYSTDSYSNIMEELQERKRAKAAIEAARNQRERSINGIKVWCLLYLDGIISPISYDTVSKVINKPDVYPINAIKEVKYLCLSYLPESTHGDSIKKAELLHYLNSLIVSKAEVLMNLSTDQDDYDAYKRELEEIDNTYAIIREGTSYTNSAVPVAKQVASLLEGNGYQEGSLKGKVIEVPESEPKPEDYKNRMAYNIAYRKWTEARSAAGLVRQSNQQEGSQDNSEEAKPEPVPESELVKAYKLLGVGSN